MRVGQLSESDAVDALRLPFCSLQHARGSHVQANYFGLGNPGPNGSVPMVSSASDLAVIVLGGPGKRSSRVPTFGGTTHSVTWKNFWEEWLIAPGAAAGSPKWPRGY